MSWITNNIIFRYLNKGQERSIKAKKNIAFLFLLRVIGLGTSLLMVPVVLGYLGETKYGLWVTISSIINWFTFFNIGLGNGLRNKFAECKAIGKYKLARIYVSSTYVILTIVISVVLLIFNALNFTVLHWDTLLNAPPELVDELQLVAFFLSFFFAFRFVLGLITNILMADQRPAVGDAFNTAGSFLAFIAAFLLSHFHQESSSLVYLVLCVGSLPVLSLLTAHLYLYKKDYKIFSPKIAYARMTFAKPLMNIGVKFFIIQIAVLIIFQTDYIIISKLFSPQEVTPYHIAHRYFSVVGIFFGVIITPFWSAFTEAFAKKDFVWIKSILRKLLFLMIPISFIITIMAVLNRPIIQFWAGIEIEQMLIIFMAVFTFIGIWNNIFAFFLNGVSIITLQLTTSIVGSIINIPLSILLAVQFNYGVSGVIIATIISLSFFAVLGSIQTYIILRKK